MCNSISHCHGGLEAGRGVQKTGRRGGVKGLGRGVGGGSVLLGKLANDSNECSVLVL